MEYNQDGKYFRTEELKRVKEPMVQMKLRRFSRRFVVRILVLLSTVAILYFAWLQIRKDDTFIVNKVEIYGCEYSDAGAITAQLKELKGRNLFDIDIEQISRRLERYRWVKQCKTVRTIPETISVYIEEHTPVAVANIAGRYFLVAKEGDVIDLYTRKDFKEFLPIINLSNEKSNSEAGYKVSLVGKMLEKIREENPYFYSVISEVVFDKEQAVGLVLNNDNNILLLNSDDNGAGLKKYFGLYKEIKAKYPMGCVVDLRFNNQVVIKQDLRSI